MTEKYYLKRTIRNTTEKYHLKEPAEYMNG